MLEGDCPLVLSGDRTAAGRNALLRYWHLQEYELAGAASHVPSFNILALLYFEDEETRCCGMTEHSGGDV